MGVKNQYTVVRDRKEWRRNVFGNQGPQRTAVAEEEQEVKKKKNKTITQRETAMSITIV
jgi:hypothetical protein